MTITVNVLTTLGSDPDLYTFLGFIDGAGTDEDPVLNDTSTKFNAEVSLFDAVFVTTGTGYTYDKFGRPLGTGTVATSTIVESGVSVIKYTHSTPVKLGDIVNGIVLFASGNDPTQGFTNVGQPYTFYDDHHTTYLLDNIYMFDDYNYIGNSGDDTFTSGFLNDKLDGKAGNDELHGNFGDDTIVGGLGDDFLFGDQGDDTLDGGAGNDTLNGGAAFPGGEAYPFGPFFDGDFLQDWATYASITVAGGVTANLSTGMATSASTGTDTLIGIENLRGSKNADFLTGDDNSNIIEGGGGNDTLDGGGNTSGPGDFLSYFTSTSLVNANLTSGTVSSSGGGIDTVTNFENLVGTKFNDILTGNGSDNWLEGALGNDTLNGNGGNDFAVYVLTPTGVTVDLAIQGGATQNTKGAGTDKLIDIDGIIGSFHTDKLSGDGGNNIIWGLDGNDFLLGRGGADTLFGHSGNDTVSYAGSSGVTVDLNIQDGTTAQVSVGSDADGDILQEIENLVGSSNNDTLIGDSGNNAIQGGLGADTLTGGSGSDFFRYASKDDAATGETITDFEQGIDKIDLALIDAKDGVAGNQIFKWLGNDVAFSNRKGELHFNSSSHILEGDTNGDGVADFQIQLDVSITALTTTDLIL